MSVSRIGFGCEQLGGTDWGVYDVRDTFRAVQQAADLGVTLFDTANVYGLGESERALSRALGSRRHEMIIVTKGGVCWDASAGGRARTFIDLSRSSLRASVEASLERLAIDSIPLYLLHWPDRSVPIEESLEAVCELKNAGKIREIGLSNFSIHDVRRAEDLTRIAAIEVRYNLLDRSADAELFPYCSQRGIGVLAFGPLAEGLLAGKYDSGSRFEPGDRRSRLGHFQGDSFRTSLVIAERVKRVAQERSRTPVQVAINWVLSNDAVSSVVVGMKNSLQLQDVIESVGWNLEESDARSLIGSTADAG